jgi:hypothetical protein
MVSTSPMGSELWTEVPVASKEEEPLRILRAETKPLFAVLDTARNAGIPRMLRESGERYSSLLNGRRADHLGSAAPYLVAIERRAETLPRILRGWGRSWGVFVVSEAPIDELRRHFRRMWLVRAEGRTLYFRYYDPRVLRQCVRACSSGQAASLLGPVESYVLEGEHGRTLLRLGSVSGGPSEARIDRLPRLLERCFGISSPEFVLRG